MLRYRILRYDADNGLQDAVNGNNNNNENTPTTDTTPGTNESEMDTDTDIPGAPTPPREFDPHTARVPERPVPWSEMFIQTVHTFYSRGAPIPVVRTDVRTVQHFDVFYHTVGMMQCTSIMYVCLRFYATFQIFRLSHHPYPAHIPYLLRV
jgi:hypothetical protein